ncbi:MerR family DNA-binding transcriptional regulator [Amycolatopsis rubida]|uniref:MerR family DNA-binding transcriptional regulator n=1 Tax=Amycolatopsis TaxID=1813 RepID=UPI0030B807B7
MEATGGGVDRGGDVVRGKVEPDRAETGKPAGVRGQRGVQSLPSGLIALAGAPVERGVQHAHFLPERSQVDVAFRVRPGREEHGAVDAGFAEEGEVLAHWVVNVAVGVDDQQQLPVGLGARNAAAGTSAERWHHAKVKLSGGAMRIGQLAEHTGTSERLLRYYERVGLLTEDRLPNGYRD